MLDLLRRTPPRGSSPRTRPQLIRALALVTGAILALSLAACGGSGSDAETQPANTAAAQQAITPYMGHPSPFPVNIPLGKRLPAGTEFVFLQCGTPVCAIFGSLLKPAVETIGGKLTIINAGSTAASSQSAVSSAAARKPAAVLITGIDPAIFGNGLKTLSDAGTKVVSLSVAKDITPYGITFNYIGAKTFELAGRLMANWVITQNKPDTNVVFYGIPALDYSSHMQNAFRDELAKNCPSCKFRNSDIDLATMGTTSPRTIVTDLQSHPDTNVAVFASSEAARGLPAAFKAANLSPVTMGYAPSPSYLQDMKDGNVTAGLAVDFPISAWAAVDATARLILGQPVTPQEAAGDVPIQLLERKDITFDPSHGWTGYPDFAQRFSTLWSA